MPATRPEASGAGVSAPRLLLLEPDATDARRIDRALKSDGYAFITRRACGRRGLARALRDFRPDVVITADRLADMSGFEALDLLRDENRRLPVIGVTGALEDAEAVGFLRRGAVDYLAKDRLGRLPEAVMTAVRNTARDQLLQNARDEVASGEVRHRALIEASSDWIWEADGAGRFTYSNPSVRDLIGYAPGDLIGRPFMSIAAEDDRAQMHELFARRRKRARPRVALVSRLQAKDGREVIVESHARPFYDASGELLGWRGDSRDITERRAVDRERNRQAAILRAIQEMSPDGMLVVGPAGEIVSHNRRFTELFDIPSEFFSSGRDQDLLRHGLAAVKHPQAFIEKVQAYYAQPELGGCDELELADGRILERNTAPIRLPDGALVGRVWFFRDITERRRAEAEIAREAAILQAVQATSPDGVVVIGADRKIVAHNARMAEVWRLPPDVFDSGDEAPVMGRALAATADPGRTMAMVQGYYANPQRSGSDEVLLADGRTVESVTSPMRLHDGTYGGRVWFFRDITERKQAEQDRLRQAAVMAAVQETSPDGVLVVGPRGEVITRNQRFSEIFHIPAEAFASGEDAPVLERAVAAAKDPQAFLAQVEDYYAHPDRSGRDEVHLADGRILDRFTMPAQLPDGRNIGRVWFFRDITDKIQAHLAIRESEERFRNLVENSQDWIWQVDAAGAFTYSSPRSKAFVGLDPDAVIGRPFLDFMAAEEADRVRQIFADVLRRKAAFSQLEQELVGPSGRRVLIEVTGVPVFSERGDLTGVQGVARDITQRRQAEARAREDEARFRALVDQDLSGIFILNDDATLAYINPGFARSLGYEAADVIGRPMAQFVADESLAETARRFAGVLAREPGSRQIEAQLKRKDGGLMPVLAQGALSTLDGKPVVLGVMLDLTERRKTELALLRLNRTLHTLSAGNEALVRAKREDELFDAMCRILVERGGYLFAWVGVPQDDAARSVTPVAWSGDHKGFLDEVEISWSAKDPRGMGVTGRAIRTGKPQTNQNFLADPSMKPWSAKAASHGFASSASFPLKQTGKVFAVLCLYSGEVDAFNADELALLNELANDIAFGVRALRTEAGRKAAIERWRSGLESTIAAIAGTMEMRDPYTAGHQHRVATLAVAIARELKLPNDQIQGIKLAGVIHDIGKITIPAELLTKPTRLTPLEFQLIQTHAQAGYEVLKNVDFPWPIAEIILQHHERIDGSGYPRRLKSGQILLDAKILTVADVIEAMMSHRPYRPALGLDAALAEVEKGAGQIYDPTVVAACLRLFREKGFELG